MKLPQISLRELFLLVVIAAMACGWWVQYRAAKSRYDAISQEYVRLYQAAHLVQTRRNVWELDFSSFPLGRQLVDAAGGTIPADMPVPIP